VREAHCCRHAVNASSINAKALWSKGFVDRTGPLKRMRMPCARNPWLKTGSCTPWLDLSRERYDCGEAHVLKLLQFRHVLMVRDRYAQDIFNAIAYSHMQTAPDTLLEFLRNT
jgi:hypothetical protein